MKNSIKRAQSQARLSFAERENFRPKVRQIKKTILTLVALIAAATGAWAQEEVLLTTVTATSLTTYSQSPDGIVTVTLDNIGGYAAYYGWLCNDNYTGIVTVEAAQGYTITRCVFRQHPSKFPKRVLEDDLAPFTATMDGAEYYVYAATSTGDAYGDDFMEGISSIEVYGYAASSGTPVPLTWDAATPNTATLTNGMPAGNVTVNVEYYPQATVADGAVTAVAGVKATTDDPLVTLDKTKLIGASGMMYYVGTTDTKPAYNAEGWTSEVPTAADITMAKTVYVWYYPVGADSDNPAKTYSDGEMNINALQVAVADPPTYAITLAEGTEDAGKWTISQVEGLLGGETVTATYSGSRKVKSVKAVKKNSTPAAIPLTIEAITAGTINVDEPKNGMQYSLNGGAKTTMTAYPTTINVAAGDKVQFYGNGTSITSYYGTNITGSGNGFTCKVYGNIMSLVDETGFATAKKLSAGPTFYRLFAQNTMLTDASGLLLPATELAQECYSQMFRDCTALTAAPEELPATELAGNCYRSMFMSCTALTTAPVLPATELVERCYYQMFINCSKLATVTCLAESGINTNSSTTNWLRSAGSQVEGTKTVYTVSTANWPEGDTSGIPTGWTRVNVDN